ncbi:DUF2165 family protein [Streptomyces sp. NRRL B-24572]|uniref:DUF2165 family protein n=1 Tax=Streptomyces sp. NRRL B-24572 TaxID=1962156 RepID=UPI000D1C0403
MLRLGAPLVAATAPTATVALHVTLVAFGNITGFGPNQQFVASAGRMHHGPDPTTPCHHACRRSPPGSLGRESGP